MDGLLERLAKLSLQKAGKLAKKGGKYGGAALGTMAGGPVGGVAGGAAGEAVGGGIKSLLDTLAQSGQSPYGMQGGSVGNVGSFQPRQGFGGRLAGNFGHEMGSQAIDAGADWLKNKFDPIDPLNEMGTEDIQEELSVAQQLEALLDSLSPEERASILAKYTGGL